MPSARDPAGRPNARTQTRLRDELALTQPPHGGLHRPAPPGRHSAAILAAVTRRSSTTAPYEESQQMAQITQPVAPERPLFNCTLRPLKVPNAAETTANRQKSRSGNSAP